MPFLALYFFDWIMFVVIFVSIAKRRRFSGQMQSKQDNKNLKENLIIALSLAVVFGLGWGFGLLATSYSSEAVTIVFQVIFSIFVGAQGLLLFLLHGVRNIEARSMWNNWVTSFSTRARLSYSSRTTKTPNSKYTSESGATTLPNTLLRKETEQSMKSERVDMTVIGDHKDDLSKTEQVMKSEPVHPEQQPYQDKIKIGSS